MRERSIGVCPIAARIWGNVLLRNATIAHFWAGAFFDTSAPGRDITYSTAWAAYKF